MAHDGDPSASQKDISTVSLYINSSSCLVACLLAEPLIFITLKRCSCLITFWETRSSSWSRGRASGWLIGGRMLTCSAGMCHAKAKGQTELPTALTTDLSAHREEERLISLRGPEGFITISQQTIIMSLEGRGGGDTYAKHTSSVTHKHFL